MKMMQSLGTDADGWRTHLWIILAMLYELGAFDISTTLILAKSKVSQSKSAAAHAGVVRALAEHVIATAIKKIKGDMIWGLHICATQ